jgi:hypothetical protein
VVLVLAGVVCFYGLLYTTDRNLQKVRNAVVSVFKAIKPKAEVKEFLEYRELFVKGNNGNILEVATGEETVELSRESSIKILNQTIPGVTTSSKVVVPATFRYHIDMSGEWSLIQEENRLYVIAPALQPSLPVAFDSEKMQKFNPAGWSRYFAGGNMAELVKTITPELKNRAIDKENMKRFEPDARQSIAKFVQTWLVGKELWDTGKIDEIYIYFPEELVDTQDKTRVPDFKYEINQDLRL